MARTVVLALLAGLMLFSMCAVQAQRLAVGEISVSVTVPTTGWKAEIQEVRRVENELWALCRLIPPKGMAGQAISTVTDTISLRAPALPVRHFIIGASHTWPTSEEHTFISSINELGEKWQNGTVFFRRDIADDQEKFASEIAITENQLNALHPGDIGVIRFPSGTTVVKASADGDIAEIKHAANFVRVRALEPGKTKLVIETKRNESSATAHFDIIVCETEWRSDIKRLAEAPTRLIGMMVFVQGNVHAAPETVDFQVFGEKLAEDDWILANTDTRSAVWITGMPRPEVGANVDLAALVIEANDGWTLQGIKIVKQASRDIINKVASGQYISLQTICERREICNFKITGDSLEILNHYPRFAVYLRASKPGKATLEIFKQSVLQQLNEQNQQEMPQADIPPGLLDRLRNDGEKVEFEVFMYEDEIPAES